MTDKRKLLAEAYTDVMKPGGAGRVRQKAIAFEHLYALATDLRADNVRISENEIMSLTELRELIDELHSLANGGRE